MSDEVPSDVIGQPMGEVSALNTGCGDMKFTFDKNNPVETERARQCVQHMLQSGYILLLTLPDNKVVRCTGFDAERDEYIIAQGPGMPPTVAAEGAPAAEPRRRGRPVTRIPATEAAATAIPRTAGG